MQEGGSQYGVPPQEMTPFAAAGRGTRPQVLGIPGPEQLQQPQQQQKSGTSQQQQQSPPQVEAASPISSRPPMRMGNFDELAPTGTEGFPDEDALAAAGDEAGRGGVSSNRWPREETLALLRIRSEMDAAFRDATLKGPLWEDVSRKLAELGYKRSAKKCKEKFENVHKYYKRTKDGRAGRQDGKSYRFFSQLEALHSNSGATTATAAAATVPTSAPAARTPSPPSSSIGMVGSSGRLQPTPLNAIPLTVGTAPHLVPEPTAGTTTPGVSYPFGGISFSSNNSSSASESEEEDTEEGLPDEPRKRKRRGGGGGGGVGNSRKMMNFFEGLMKQVIERQEAMQQKFLEMIEKREQDRMIREEAWRRQEMARLSREHEMMAQEREISASRDAAIIAFLQKMTGQIVPVPPSIPAVAPAHPVPQLLSQQQAPPAPVLSASTPPHQPQPQPQQQHSIHRQGTEIFRTQALPLEVVVLSTEAQEVAAAGGGSSMDPASSRWPKSEVHTLIKLRSEMETRYQEAGPKGPLWEEIAAGMRRMGHNRSAKRCKEKWENINKYFKKVKDGNKKRPEDAKTCPYFHQLDALYRKKIIGAGSSMGNHMTKKELETSPPPAPVSQLDVAAAQPPQLALPQQPQVEAEGKNGGGSNNDGNRDGSKLDGKGVPILQVQTSNDAHTSNFFDKGVSSDGTAKEPEDIVKGLMDQQRHSAMDDYDKMEETDSDSMDQDEDNDDDADDEKMKMEYQIEYQEGPGVNRASNGGGNQSTAATAGSFMAMVQ